jgi:protein ImuB
MSRLYACIISGAEKPELIAAAEKFAYRIEWLGDGVLFETSGLENLIGSADDIAAKIDDFLAGASIRASVAVAENAASAILQARSKKGTTVVSDAKLERLPLERLEIDRDTLDVFDALGFSSVRDLKRVPENELIARYGAEFRNVLDLVKNKGKYVLTPNLRDDFINWAYRLDFPVIDFEQLIFIVRHGLEQVFKETDTYGFRTERLGISLGLERGGARDYEIKVSFPTLDIKFWSKIISLRINSDPPPEGITSIEVTAHFARPRTAQKSLFATTSLEPESLLLTVSKIKKLIGEENAGVPVVLDQRLSRAFALAADRLPAGIEPKIENNIRPHILLNYFDPPLKADVVVNQKRLMFVRTPRFSGKVVEYGGVWSESAQWWSAANWKTEEWDVELENGGIYRLARAGRDWFVTGEYD